MMEEAAMRRVGLAVVLTVSVGCSPPPDSAEPTVYVGALGDGADASLAIAVQGHSVAVYACAKDPTRDPYPRWLTTGSDVDGTSVDVALGGWAFDGSWGGGAAVGSLVEPDGTRLAWSGASAPRPSLSGLYALYDSGCLTGVIVTQDGSGPVVRGAWCDAGGDVRQIIPLVPLTLTEGRLSVQVAAGAETRTLVVSPVTLPMR
jgi:hypothetical protein